MKLKNCWEQKMTDDFCMAAVVPLTVSHSVQAHIITCISDLIGVKQHEGPDPRPVHLGLQFSFHFCKPADSEKIQRSQSGYCAV